MPSNAALNVQLKTSVFSNGHFHSNDHDDEDEQCVYQGKKIERLFRGRRMQMTCEEQCPGTDDQPQMYVEQKRLFSKNDKDGSRRRINKNGEE